MTRAAALALALLLVPVAAACGGDEPPPEEVALSITGAVAAEQALTRTDLDALGWETLELQRPGDSMRPYNGLRLSTVLATAGVAEGAATITFVTADGARYSLPAAEVLGCADCSLVALMGGRLQTAMPGFSEEAWVYNVVEVAIG